MLMLHRHHHTGSGNHFWIIFFFFNWEAIMRYIINPCFSSYHHTAHWHETQTQVNPKGSYTKPAAKKGQRLESTGGDPSAWTWEAMRVCPKALSSPDLPGMGAQDAVCPALRAEWGSSSSSLYSVSMVSLPSPKLPSCRPQPRTLTMYFFCNKAWPALQASALAGTHTATVKGW